MLKVKNGTASRSLSLAGFSPKKAEGSIAKRSFRIQWEICESKKLARTAVLTVLATGYLCGVGFERLVHLINVPTIRRRN